MGVLLIKAFIIIDLFLYNRFLLSCNQRMRGDDGAQRSQSWHFIFITSTVWMFVTQSILTTYSSQHSTLVTGKSFIAVTLSFLY